MIRRLNDRAKALALRYVQIGRRSNAARALGLDHLNPMCRCSVIPLTDAATLGGLPNSGVDAFLDVGVCGSCAGPVRLNRETRSASCPCGDTVLPAALLTGAPGRTEHVCECDPPEPGDLYQNVRDGKTWCDWCDAPLVSPGHKDPLA